MKIWWEYYKHGKVPTSEKIHLRHEDSKTTLCGIDVTSLVWKEEGRVTCQECEEELDRKFQLRIKQIQDGIASARQSEDLRPRYVNNRIYG